jgi:hypothetical protein
MEQASRGASPPCQGEGTITRSQLDSTYRRGADVRWYLHLTSDLHYTSTGLYG